MKKLLVGFVLFFGVFLGCFCSSESVNDLIDIISEGSYNLTNQYQTITSFTADGKVYCLRVTSYSSRNSAYPIRFGINSSEGNLSAGNYLNIHPNQLPYIGCISTNQDNSTRYLIIGKSDGLNVNVSFNYELFRLDSLLNTQLPVLTSLQCQTQYSLIPISSVDQNYCTSNNLCPDQYTSLECQTEYNLIPVDSVTENYCTSNFNLISPSDCPMSSGTGAINWSSVWINNQQVPGSPNIFLSIYDRLDRSQTYVNQDMYIEINGPEGDEDYINGIIDINSYRPTSEDFTTVFVGGLTLVFPYIVIVLFVVFIRKLIRKIFR